MKIPEADIKVFKVGFMSVNLDIQKLLIQAVKNIEFFKKNKIECYSSVPANIKMPYIKIIGLSNQNIENVSSIRRYCVKLFVATTGKNNRQILNIMEELYLNLPDEIMKVVYENLNDFKISIQSIQNMTYDINEDLKNQTWFGNFLITIDIV